MNTTQTKQCKRCKRTRTLDFFWGGRKSHLYSAACKDCHGIKSQQCRRCDTTFLAKPKPYCSAECKRADRPQTFMNCKHCGTHFGPVGHLSRKYCTRECKSEAQKKAVKVVWKATREAVAARSKLARAVKSGILKRPELCEKCSGYGHIEAAHYDYSEPLRVRWLCVSCHRKWDRADPKGGATLAEAVK